MKTPANTRFHTLALALSAVLAMHCGPASSDDPSLEEASFTEFEDFDESSQGLLVSCTGLPCGAICHWGARLGRCNRWSQCVPQGTPLSCAPSGDGGVVSGDGGFDGGFGGFDGGPFTPDSGLRDGGFGGFDGSIFTPDSGLRDGGPFGLDGSIFAPDAGLFDGGARG